MLKDLPKRSKWMRGCRQYRRCDTLSYDITPSTHNDKVDPQNR